MSYIYSKERIAQRNKPWQKDEVMEEVVSKIKSGKKAKKVKGKVLNKAIQQRVKFQPSKRYSGKKTKAQQLVETLEIPEELPDLAEPYRTFAFRRATEERKNFDWANIFHVSPYTIRNWLLRPDIQRYILKVSQERIALMAERWDDLEKAALAKYAEILRLPPTDDNMDVLLKAARDVLAVRRGEVPGEKGPTIVMQQSQDQGQIALSKSEANMSIEELKHELAEIEAVNEMLEEE